MDSKPQFLTGRRPASAAGCVREDFILKMSCPATTGIVAAVTSFLAERKCYNSEMAQFDDEGSQRFFMRAVFHFTEGASDEGAVRREFSGV
ncbi:MAG: hypothetical protein LBG69_02285, partial [Zoogloeaceae bacterium]|nr:hypothetical protein [Zoogloeaceae bacterium]